MRRRLTVPAARCPTRLDHASRGH
uniref:Zinc transporter 6 family protein n=1 Tax=Rhizophora mucronata TaxID=61149 RepID=A0A2P2JGM2_RHIMU